ncbi:glutamate receptor ionotropic: kainate 2-like protein [Dinothrombium tinctorium]|uniref:Glutamate receptor ionotropic: kainate 2-like protein n=1 Tax=Dinothrombium tinctorium TaxID=1965070 RepID=A0A443RR87_9ACAR|nr:glutamate receptor ionotropic: kainate 2-like protein [Dinothrombium tinctorium]
MINFNEKQDNRSLTAYVHSDYRIDALFVHDLLSYSIEAARSLDNNLWSEDKKCTRTHKQFNNLQSLLVKNQNTLGEFGEYVFNELANNNYQKINLKIEQIELSSWSRTNLGAWIYDSPSGELLFTSPWLFERRKVVHKAATYILPPFMMKNMNGSFYGYLVDLMKEIQAKSGDAWDFEIYEVPDGKAGNKRMKNGEWNGVIGELKAKRASIGLAPLSVMAERDKVVDFTVPYYDLVGLTILIKKPAASSHLFKFVNVLEDDVWYSALMAYIFTSILLFTFDLMSPYSYTNLQRNRRSREKCRVFNLKECFWFCIISLTPQGGGEAPRNVSGRLVVATWWIFGFIMISMYTANLAAYLTVSRLENDIKSFDELARQYNIKFSVVNDSVAMDYFARRAGIEKIFQEKWKEMALDESVDSSEREKLAIWDYPLSDKYIEIWQRMENSGFEPSFESGVRRVKESNFALIADSIVIKYAELTNCDLEEIGSEFSRKPIALAVQKNSKLLDDLNSAILQLVNGRKLIELKERWWNRQRKKCAKTLSDSTEGIAIENIGGVFIIIFVGIFFACFTLLIEYIQIKQKRARVSPIKLNKNSRETLFAETPLRSNIAPAVYKAPIEIELKQSKDTRYRKPLFPNASQLVSEDQL